MPTKKIFCRSSEGLLVLALLLSACGKTRKPSLSSCYRASGIVFNLHDGKLTGPGGTYPIALEKRKIGWVASIPAKLILSQAGDYELSPSEIGNYDWVITDDDGKRIKIVAQDGRVFKFTSCS